MKKRLISTLFLLFFTATANGAMYKCKMSDGSFQYSDRPCEKRSIKDKQKALSFTGQKINILYENTDIREVLKKVASYGGYSVSFHRYVTGVISTDYQQKPWDEILFRITEAHDLTAVPGSDKKIYITPNQLRMSGSDDATLTPERKYKKCIEVCDQRLRTCLKLSPSVAYGNSRWGCRDDRYLCHKSCRPSGISIY